MSAFQSGRNPQPGNEYTTHRMIVLRARPGQFFVEIERVWLNFAGSSQPCNAWNSQNMTSPAGSQASLST